MKKLAFVLFSLVVFASCSNETAAPVEDTLVSDTVSEVVDSAALDAEVKEVEVEEAK